MSTCVNLNSKDFKDCCNRLNVSAATLEPIVHEYINIEGNENSFPSDVYIEEKIHGRRVAVTSDKQIQLWEERYSQPKTFNSAQEANAYYTECNKFFPKEAIGFKETVDGKYEVKVVKPKKSSSLEVSSEENDIMLQQTPRLILENKKERVRSVYQKAALDVAKRKIAKAEEYKNRFKGFKIAINKGSDTGEFEAEKAAIEVRESLRKRLSDVASKIDFTKKQIGGEYCFVLELKIKTKDQIENDEIANANSYVNSMTESELDNEIARLDSDGEFDEDLAFHIKAKDIPVVKEQIAKKNPYLTEEEINETIDFLVSLENNPETNLYVKIVTKWIKNKVVQLPRDNGVILSIFTDIRRLGLNVESYYSPFDALSDIISANSTDVFYEDGINPFKIPQFHFIGKEISADGKELDVFEVEDTDEGRLAVSQALADTTPKRKDGSLATGDFSSPWCIGTFNYNAKTKKASRTNSADNFWKDRYTAGKRRIAFCAGYPVAMCSSSWKEIEWWDFRDTPHNSLSEVKVSEREEMYKLRITESKNTTIYTPSGTLYLENDGTPSTIYQDGLRYSEFDGYSTYFGNPIDFDEFVFSGTPLHAGIASLFPLDSEENNICIQLRIPNRERVVVKISITDEIKELYKAYLEIHESLYNHSVFIGEEFLSKFRFAPESILHKTDELRTNRRRAERKLEGAIRTLIIKEVQKYIKENNLEQQVHTQPNTPPIPSYPRYQQPVPAALAEATAENTINTVEEEYANQQEDLGNREPVYRDNETTIREELEYVSEEELDSITERVNSNSKVRKFGKRLIQRMLQALKNRDLKESYNTGLRKEVNKDLEAILRNILKEYHFETLEGDLKEIFGPDVLGATDFLNKVIYLANEGDRNAITGLEEFSHAFIKLMGSVYHKPENRKRFPETAKYSEIRDLVEQTSLYQQVLETYKDNPQYQNEDGSPDLRKIKEEAVGQALAAVLLERAESKNNTDKSFFEKIAEWLLEVLKSFKAIFDDGAKLDKELNKIADSILDGTYNKKYLQKISNKEKKQLKLQDYSETITNSVKEDGGIGLSILQDVTATGGFITGSLSYRKQTPVYRKAQDSLHDIDVVYPLSTHSWHTKHPYWRITKTVSDDKKLSNEQLVEKVKELYPISQLLQRQPNMQIMWVYPDADSNVVINAIVCDDPTLVEKFKSLTGNYNNRLNSLTAEERQKIHLVDIFLHKNNDIASDYITDNEFNLNLTHYKHSFKAKLKYGRAKDIMDYQTLNPGENRKYLIDKTNTVQQPNLMYQIKPESNVTKVISGGQTGVDTIGLQVAKELGIETGGKAPKGFLREKGYDTEDISLYGLEEITDEEQADYTLRKGKTDPYTGRTELNVRNSDGTVYFSTADDSAGKIATKRAADEWDKPFIENPTAEELRQWIKENNIKTLNVAGNRGSKLKNGEEIKEILREALSFKEEPSKFSKEEFEAKVLEIQEALGVSEEDARKLAKIYDEESTEDDLKNNEEAIEELDAIYKETLKVGEQIEALTESKAILKSEITEIAYDIVYAISDFLSQWQDNPETLFKNFTHLNKEDIEKIKTMSRGELVSYIGVGNLLSFIKENYFGTINEEDSTALIDKKELLYENFDAVIKFGISAFNGLEDFSLTYSEIGYTVSQQSTEDSDSELTNAEQSIKEENGDKQEHWQVDSRTIDNFLSMSQLVKRELVRLYLVDNVVDENGQVVTKTRVNDYGINKRVDPKDATSCILRWTRGALTLDQMIKLLEAKEATNPWVKGLLDKLKDTSGKYTDFQSQFFTVFCKHFQEYYIVTEEKQKDGSVINKVIPVNINPALREVIKAIKLSYELNAHPMFANGKVNQATFEKFKKAVEKLTKLEQQPYASLDKEQISKGISYVANLLGFSISNEEVELALNPTSFTEMMKNLRYILANVTKGLSQETYEPFVFVKGGNSIERNLKEFLKPLTDTMEDVAISSFYDSGKMYQSYVLPSWLSKTMDKFLTLEGQEYEDFLQKEFGQYEWFRDTRIESIKKGWRCPWLQQLSRMSLEQRKEMFGHHVQLNYLGHNYMRNMSAPEYVLATLGEFFSDTTSDKESIGYSYYKIPMMSNKPSLEFIKFIRYKGLNYEDSIIKGLKDVYLQELMRIQTVIKRGYDKKKDSEFIVPFDSRGKHFLFLEYLDEYLNGSQKDTELGRLLNKKVNGEKLPDSLDANGEKISGDDRLLELVENEIRAQMDSKANKLIQEYKSNGIFEAAKSIQGVGKTDAEVEANLRNFIWNDTFAAINILEMTITDLAYYKNTEDVQKRLAQIHAPGMKGNIHATDYDGNPVCDGYLRTAFLADYEKEAVVQNIVENLEIVFDRKVNEATTEAEKEYWENTKKSIIDAVKTSINVADAQAYNCPTSYRKKALMFGKWSKEFEETYEKLRKGEWNATDLEAAFQPLKPFVYTQVTKNSGVEDAPIKTMKVGMQFKNSEYLLIMADAILQGEDTGKPNLLRAIFNVMEESARKNPTKGIDTFMFASAVKAGLHGRIDLGGFIEGGDAEAYMRSLIYDDSSEDGYSPTFIHTYPAEDYIIQQEVPKHFLDHDQAHGSQERMIIPSDLQEVYEDGTLVYYEYKDGDKIIRKTAKEFKEEYEKTIASNIQQSIDDLFDELGLRFKGPDAKKLRNIALSKILQKEILSSPRYGVDLYIACSIDKDGNFKIPLGDPIQSKRVEQLINSIIKNRINKQKIAGGPVVQVSNFGMSKRLNIKFKNKQGDILPTLTEWLDENPGKTAEDFKEYLKENQAGVAYYECYAPAYMKEMFECFMDENGNIDVKAIEESNPEMLEMIGYRIPSEDLYSVAPLRIMGFLPKEAGEGIMLPYEITLITGSDFDIDKFYLMRKEFNIKLKRIKDIKDELFKKHKEIGADNINNFITKAVNPKTRQQAYAEYPELGKTFRAKAFSVEKPNEGRRYNNNKIIDMSLGVLTHETSAHRMLNPGGFDPQKRMGYMVTAYKLGRGDWDYLNKLSIDDLKELCYTDKNLVYMDVNTQFYEQNNVAGAILGMFAVQKIAHAVLENNKYYLDVTMALELGEDSFSFAGHKFIGLTELDPTKNSRGEYIGKILGSLVASAADAVKDPVLNLMNINSTTAPVLTTMIRLGIPFETASLLLSQQIITDLLQKYNIENLKDFTSFKDILYKEIDNLKNITGTTKGDQLSTEEMTEQELVSGLNKEASIEVKLKGLLAFEKFLKLAGELKGITYATRFNSISNAVGPLAIDNLIMKGKLKKFSNAIFELVPGKDEEGNSTMVKQEVNFSKVFAKHPILAGFRQGLDIVMSLFENNIPIVSADFNAILSSLPDNIYDKIFGDRKLFSNFVDFYLSYLLVASGCVKSSEEKIKFYTDEFPKKLFERKIKEQYPDNSFIQALRFEKEKLRGGKEKLVLKINTTGMSTTDKEKLSSGWTDLHRKNPELSKMFFEYCFFKGGIGFNPKTFMHLLPLEVKLELEGYIKTFRENPNTKASVFIDQFIRNNWFKGKVVPRIEPTKEATFKDGVLTLTGNNFALVSELAWCRIKHKDKTEHLYKVISRDTNKKEAKLIEIEPLGNNGEYLEISTEDIKKATTKTVEAIDTTITDTTMPETSNQETDEESLVIEGLTDEEVKYYCDLLSKVFEKPNSVTKFRNRTEKEKQAVKKQYKDFFAKKFKEKGISYDESEFEKLYKTFCG